MIKYLPRHREQNYGFNRSYIRQYYSDTAENAVLIPDAVAVHLLHGYSPINQYILIFDSKEAVADGSRPMIRLFAAAEQNFGAGLFDKPWVLQNGLYLCNSTTIETLTLGSANTYFYVQVD